MERLQKIEALGALNLLSGGSASLAAVSDLHQATGRDLNLVVGHKHNATVGGDMHERIEGLRESITSESQRFQASKTWMGSESLNIFKVLCDTLDLIKAMNAQIASHSHGGTPIPDNAKEFSLDGLKADILLSELKKVTHLKCVTN
ncbi:Conserved hypothetical protein [Pseudomonas viridiflava]|uniref:Uncharacterized protein n=1 Tax=Pseudomonas viridiflava TaxID=33069 RepID=A0A1Y6JS80_PSEVI|nr:Conserved hypothetical protein [Pseudomonas viridiflava]VVO22567.1 hypothetical protein PS689_04355 [Pseudomonas fluorescens]